jgi:hypothetical protein
VLVGRGLGRLSGGLFLLAHYGSEDAGSPEAFEKLCIYYLFLHGSGCIQSPKHAKQDLYP